MIKNYMITAIRQLFKQKGFNLLNILGLSAGLVGFIFAMLYAEFKLNFDTFHSGYDQIYRVVAHEVSPGNEKSYAITPAPLSSNLKEVFPEIESSICMEIYRAAVIEYNGDKFRENRVFYTKKDFFKVFPYKLIEGDANTALENPNSIILTKSIAEKYFGNNDPIGKIVRFEDGEAVVTGVMQDAPSNTILGINILAPIEKLNSYEKSKNNWSNYNYTTFIRVASGTNVDTLSKKIYNHLQSVFPDSEDYSRLKIQAIDDIHLFSDAAYDAFHDKNGLPLIYGLSVVSLFLLLLGSANFINLITARAEKRNKEISIRKTFGATKSKIMIQFFIEAFAQTFIAFFLAMIAVEILHPLFNEILNTEIEIKYNNHKTIFILLTILFSTSLLSGAYPALYMSALKPMQLIRPTVSGKPRGLNTRRLLIVFQMIVTVTMIFSAITISKQVNFLKNKALGFDKSNIIAKGMTKGFIESYDAFRAELLQNPDVISVSSVMNMPEWQGPNTSSFVGWEGNENEDKISMYFGNVGYDYFKTLNLEIIEGRPFSEKNKTDLKNSIIINEKAVKLMNMKDPIGKRINLSGDEEWGYNGKIIGVVKDYHYNSPRFPIGAFMVKLAPDQTSELLVKHKAGKRQSVDEFLNQLCAKFDEAPPINSRTMEVVIENQYEFENLMYKLINVIAFLTIILASLGLLGLITYTTEKKIKEIGVRKVLGGSFKEIVSLIFRQFAWILLIANTIAWPFSHFLNKGYLKNFEHAISIDPWIFIVSAAISVFFTTSIVLMQTIKAARQNPVISLKHE